MLNSSTKRMGPPACVVKDPRFSLTGRFWSSLVAPEVSVVPLRDPAEVAESLRHRNGMSPARTAQLWIRYTVDSLLDLPRPYLAVLDDLIDDPEVAVRQLAAATGLDDETRVTKAIAITTSRQRTLQTAPALAPDVDDAPMLLARSLYRVLRTTTNAEALKPLLEELARTWHRPFIIESRTIGAIDPADPAASLLDAATTRLAELEEEAERLQLETVELRSERDQARRELRSGRGKRSSGTDEASNTAELQKRAENAERQLECLQSRKSVRFALALSAPFKPVFRLARKGRPTNGSDTSR